MISYKGKLSVVVAIPVLGQLIGTFNLPALLGEVEALYQVAFTFIPPSAVGIANILAVIGAAITAGLHPPAVNIQADLFAKWGLLKAKYELLLNITNLLAQGSVRVYEYEGAAGTFGSELGATLSGADEGGGIAPTQTTFAVLLVAEGGSAGETTLKILRSGA